MNDMQYNPQNFYSKLVLILRMRPHIWSHCEVAAETSKRFTVRLIAHEFIFTTLLNSKAFV